MDKEEIKEKFEEFCSNYCSIQQVANYLKKAKKAKEELAGLSKDEVSAKKEEAKNKLDNIEFNLNY